MEWSKPRVTRNQVNDPWFFLPSYIPTYRLESNSLTNSIPPKRCWRDRPSHAHSHKRFPPGTRGNDSPASVTRTLPSSVTTPSSPVERRRRRRRRKQLTRERSPQRPLTQSTTWHPQSPFALCLRLTAATWRDGSCASPVPPTCLSFARGIRLVWGPRSSLARVSFLPIDGLPAETRCRRRRPIPKDRATDRQQHPREWNIAGAACTHTKPSCGSRAPSAPRDQTGDGGERSPARRRRGQPSCVCVANLLCGT
ncbi:hypothetical protein QBC39DRAFT_91778 [Podospora conica]|nr:hypothetical protein QBC39DRAFT_91778 [Schizothecium conicum]